MKPGRMMQGGWRRFTWAMLQSSLTGGHWQMVAECLLSRGWDVLYGSIRVRTTDWNKCDVSDARFSAYVYRQHSCQFISIGTGVTAKNRCEHSQGYAVWMRPQTLSRVDIRATTRKTRWQKKWVSAGHKETVRGWGEEGWEESEPLPCHQGSHYSWTLPNDS